ncbi:unnamed protein product [Heligmosomoides polygyrus]|uniref:Uncharacterized protein n=1 Tax=Heligmosomoides polygyrus TaxID=6339 RepID=A0A183FIG4_HELPZ|nr:unnamed protein product [Heligmosomoides polygyrus]
MRVVRKRAELVGGLSGNNPTDVPREADLAGTSRGDTSVRCVVQLFDSTERVKHRVAASNVVPRGRATTESDDDERLVVCSGYVRLIRLLLVVSNSKLIEPRKDTMDG